MHTQCWPPPVTPRHCEQEYFPHSFGRGAYLQRTPTGAGATKIDIKTKFGRGNRGSSTM